MSDSKTCSLPANFLPIVRARESRKNCQHLPEIKISSHRRDVNELA